MERIKTGTETTEEAIRRVFGDPKRGGPPVMDSDVFAAYMEVNLPKWIEAVRKPSEGEPNTTTSDGE